MPQKNLNMQKITEICEKTARKFDYELCDAAMEKEPTGRYLRIYIDKEGGVNIDDCEKVSRAFNDILDKEDYIEETYIFEVSSPGLGRKLKKDIHFEKAIGESVDIKTFKPIDKQKEFTGILKAFDQNTVTIAVEDKETVFNRKDIAIIKLSLDF